MHCIAGQVFTREANTRTNQIHTTMKKRSIYNLITPAQREKVAGIKKAIETEESYRAQEKAQRRGQFKAAA